MHLRSMLSRSLVAVGTGAAWLALSSSPALAQGRLFRNREECPPAPCPAPELITPPLSPSPEQRPTVDTNAPAPAAPAFQSEQVAATGGTAINMLGDLLSGPTMRCVLVPRTIYVPLTIQPPPVLVNPPPFTIQNPTVTASPPPVLVQPPPIVLANGRVIPVPPFLASPAPVTVAFDPVTVQPSSFQATPPPVVLAQNQAITVYEQRCYEILSAAARASSYKIAEDESPLPQDRVYFGFNYFDNVNDAVNIRLGGVLRDEDIFRETLGFEKTFFDHHASVGMRMPLASIVTSSDVAGVGGTQTDIGDLSICLKVAPYLDLERGNVLSGGLVITVPTGPEEFNPFDSVILQPWVGARWMWDNLYVHGFSSVAVPTDSRDVTLLFNDFGVGYYIYRGPQDALLHSIVPTFEVHINTPLNHRGAFDFADPSGTADWVTLTGATTLELGQHTTFAVGAGVPVTGPKPFDFEILAQLNYRF